MRLNGATYRDIAKHFGVSVPAAYFAVNPHKRLKGKPKKKTTGLSEVSLNVNPGA